MHDDPLRLPPDIEAARKFRIIVYVAALIGLAATFGGAVWALLTWMSS